VNGRGGDGGWLCKRKKKRDRERRRVGGEMKVCLTNVYLRYLL
jgi:hypothetical protein